jgi:hypothetical protein
MKNKLPGFQQFLVDKGFKRTCTEHCGSKVKEDYTSTFLSTCSPLTYDFEKGNKFCYWGLWEKDKPPVMFLGVTKMRIIQNGSNYRTKEDGYRILFTKWGEDRFDEIFEVFMSDNKHFEVNCVDEKNITITIEP